MSKCGLNKVAFNFIEITLRHGCSPVNLLHIFRTPFPNKTCGSLLLQNILRIDQCLLDDNNTATIKNKLNSKMVAM